MCRPVTWEKASIYSQIIEEWKKNWRAGKEGKHTSAALTTLCRPRIHYHETSLSSSYNLEPAISGLWHAPDYTGSERTTSVYVEQKKQ